MTVADWIMDVCWAMIGLLLWAMTYLQGRASGLRVADNMVADLARRQSLAVVPPEPLPPQDHWPEYALGDVVVLPLGEGGFAVFVKRESRRYDADRGVTATLDMCPLFPSVSFSTQAAAEKRYRHTLTPPVVIATGEA